MCTTFRISVLGEVLFCPERGFQSAAGVLLYVKTIWSVVHARLDARILRSTEAPVAMQSVSVCESTLR